MMTLANMITLLRLICIPFLLFLFFSGPLWLFYILLACILLSDLVDGALARAQRQITNLGKTLDPLADKTLFLSLFIALTIRGNLPMAAVIVFALPQSVLLFGALWLRWRTSRWVVIEARPLGKVSSTLLSLGLVGTLLAPVLDQHLANIALYVLYGGIALSYVAMGDYIFVALRRMETGKLRRERGHEL
jgi:cardiolipin synthase